VLLGRKRALRNALAALGQTVLALVRFLPAVLGCTKGVGGVRLSQISAPVFPLTPPSIAGPDREKRGLSERSEIASSAAPVWAEKRREPLA
jgi:hypothetical protein